jgi:hypothetical protein
LDNPDLFPVPLSAQIQESLAFFFSPNCMKTNWLHLRPPSLWYFILKYPDIVLCNVIHRQISLFCCRSQPDHYVFCSSIYLAHNADLRIALSGILLIDANGVDPKPPSIPFFMIAYLQKEIPQ